MQFANPIWLAGLGGILIPLAIHLLSRKEGKVIRIGSIRHFEETSTRQFKSIKLNEILLLILRSLLILLIVFLLAELQWLRNSDGKTNWLLIEKGLEHDRELSKLIDSLGEKGFEKREFARGFPLADDTIRETPQNYWALVESLNNEKLDSVVIISANRIQAFRGERKALPANIAWITKSLPAKENIIHQLKLGNDSVWTRTGKFRDTETEFITQIAPGNSGKMPDTVNVAVVNDKQYAYDAKLLLASLTAIDKYSPYLVSVTATDRLQFQSNKQVDWIFWLSDDPVPSHEQNLIVLKPQPSQNIIEQLSSQSWILTQRLTPERVIEKNFTSQLMQLIFPEKGTWKKANELDIRAGDEQLIDTNTSSSEKAATAYSGQTLWIVLIALTFITERIVAYKRMQ
jgi:hypothetical protein